MQPATLSSMVPSQTTPARQNGNPLDAGIVKFSCWLGPFMPFTASSVLLLNGKSQAALLLGWFGCSTAPVPYLFLWSGCSAQGGCCLCPKCSGLRCSVGSAHSFLLIKDLSLLVQVQHSPPQVLWAGRTWMDCRSSWFLWLWSTLSSPFAGSLQLKRHLGGVWWFPKAHFGVPAQPLGNAGCLLCSICHKHCHKVVYQTSQLVNSHITELIHKESSHCQCPGKNIIHS